MLTLVSFIFVLGVLIFFHELGHFLVAKKAGIRVEKFSLGFPPNIFSRTYGDTTYCIGAIPLGGYVKMAGENPDDLSSGAPYEFMSKSIGRRTAVIFAGPFMNYLLAIFILIGIAYFGGAPLVDENQIIVGEVSADSPAEKAGLKPDDIIIGVDGEQLTKFDSLRFRINAHIEEEVEVTWIHQGDTITRTMITMATPAATAEGKIDTIGIIGFSQKIIGYEEFSLIESVKRGTVLAHVIVFETVRFLKNVVTGQVSAKMMGGPVFIAQQSGKQAEKGASSLFFFMAVLSVNLAVLNVLPIPILDGGHLVFLAVEAVKGSPLSLKARAIAQQIGLVAILSLIVFATYNDIMRLFGEF